MGIGFLKKILVGIASFFIISSVHALEWPELVLDAETMRDGNVGDILAEVPVTVVEPWSVKQEGAGNVYLSITGHQETNENNKNYGMFSVTDDGSIGVAFIGTLTLSINGEVYEDAITDLITPLEGVNVAWGGTVPDSLIRAPAKILSWSTNQIQLTGKIVVVRLKTGQINVDKISYPTIFLEYRGSISSGLIDSKSSNILSATESTIAASRTCIIDFSGKNIDFGEISVGVPAQASPLANGNTTVTVHCEGKSNNQTLVTMSVTSASGQVTGDPSAIPMVISENASNDLVVKATLGSTVPNCMSSSALGAEDGKWLDATGQANYSIISFEKGETDSQAVDKNKSVNWYLCRRANTGTLRTGQYSGSAVLSVTLN